MIRDTDRYIVHVRLCLSLPVTTVSVSVFAYLSTSKRWKTYLVNVRYEDK